MSTGVWMGGGVVGWRWRGGEKSYATFGRLVVFFSPNTTASLLADLLTQLAQLVCELVNHHRRHNSCPNFLSLSHQINKSICQSQKHVHLTPPYICEPSGLCFNQDADRYVDHTWRSAITWGPHHQAEEETFSWFPAVKLWIICGMAMIVTSGPGPDLDLDLGSQTGADLTEI